MIAFDSRCRSPGLACLERNDFERNAEDLSDLFRELSVIIQFVAGTSQTATNHLLTEQLRHERSQTNDVGHRVAIPALREHSDADDTSDITARRVKGSLQFLR